MRNKKHFTLLEVVVATTLLGVIGMLIAMSVSTLQRSWEHGRRTADRMERNIALDRIAETLLRSVIDFRWPNEEENSEGLVFSGEPDELWLTAMNRSYAGRSAIRFARLYLEGDELRCDYSDTPFLPWLDLKDQLYETETISSGVIAVSFLYAEENDDGEIEWQENWSTDDHDELPLAIRMKIEWQDGSSQSWLRRQAGSSYNTELLPGE